jgi:phosphatidylinositol kinase/protein kinase (PI-3  family)
MSTQAPTSVERDELIKGWRQATLQNIQAKDVQELPWTAPKSALPGAVRIKAQGINPKGQALIAHAIWFSHLEGNQLRVVHAVVYQSNTKASKSQQSADQFIESFKLP